MKHSCLVSLFYLAAFPFCSADETQIEDPIVGGVPVSTWKSRLANKDFKVSYPNSLALGRLGKEAKPAIPMLTQLLNEEEFKDYNVRAAATRAMSGIGGEEAFAPLTKAMKDKSSLVRGLAATGLCKLNLPKKTIPLLIHALEDRDADGHVRKMSWYALAKIGKVAAPSLVEALQHRTGNVRQAASYALIKIGKPAEPELIKAVGAGDKLSRRSIVGTLASIGPTAAAIPKLNESLKDSYYGARSAAAAGLGRIGAAAKGSVPKLIDMAKSDDSNDVRLQAAVALLKIAPENTNAHPHVLAILNSEDRDSRSTIVRRLGDLGTKGEFAVPALTNTLNDDYAAARANAARALGQIGPASEPAIPQLIELLSDESSNARRRAIGALGELGPLAKAALPKLQEIESGKNRSLAKSATAAIAKIKTQ